VASRISFGLQCEYVEKKKEKKEGGGGKSRVFRPYGPPIQTKGRKRSRRFLLLLFLRLPGRKKKKEGGRGGVSPTSFHHGESGGKLDPSISSSRPFPLPLTSPRSVGRGGGGGERKGRRIPLIQSQNGGDRQRGGKSNVCPILCVSMTARGREGETSPGGGKRSSCRSSSLIERSRRRGKEVRKLRTLLHD